METGSHETDCSECRIWKVCRGEECAAEVDGQLQSGLWTNYERREYSHAQF